MRCGSHRSKLVAVAANTSAGDESSSVGRIFSMVLGVKPMTIDVEDALVSEIE